MMRGKPKVVSIVGARPQFIKLAPLAQPLNRICSHVIIHSGQHYDYELSQVFFDQLRIPEPDINLNVGSGEHGRQTGRILERCEEALLEQKPDMVIVYGDTNTTLAGALAAAKLGMPVGHVEAGLRSFRKTMPEEINRKMTDHISDLLFYPTPTARKNLAREGISRGLVRSGDLMFEILNSCLSIISRRKKVFADHGVVKNDYVMVTLHRAENVDDPGRLEKFVLLMESLSVAKLFLAHPHTIKNLRHFKLYDRLGAVPDIIIEQPQPYIETLALMAGARAVMTDSGGIQKEASFLGRPCLTLRPETEWVETVRTGANFIVDMSLPEIRRVLDWPAKASRKPGFMINGRKPSAIICTAIEGLLHKSR